MSNTLLQRTRALLNADRRPYHVIAAESGLPVYWLRKVAWGEIRAPGVDRVQKLYEFLSNRKLIVK
jgi:hypothetical protein